MPRRSKLSSRSAKRSSRKKRTSRRVFRASGVTPHPAEPSPSPRVPEPSPSPRVPAPSPSLSRSPWRNLPRDNIEKRLTFEDLPPEILKMIAYRRAATERFELINKIMYKVGKAQRFDEIKTYFSPERTEINMTDRVRLGNIEEFVEELPKLLQRPKKLTAFTVGGNNSFSSNDTLAIFEALKISPALQRLDISGMDKFDKEGLSVLANYLPTSNITEFTFESAGIGDKFDFTKGEPDWWDVQMLSGAFAKLVSLNLGFNSLLTHGCILLVGALKTAQQLKTLLLVHNDIDSTAGTEIADLIRANDKLTRIDLSNNYLGTSFNEHGEETGLFVDDGVQAILDAINSKKTHINVILNYNHISKHFRDSFRSGLGT